ncbi:MAG: galactose-1-epimerase, partial [Bacillota bacterium]
ELMPVAGTPFDFNTPKSIGCDIGADDVQMRLAGGFDHNYALRGDGAAAEAWCEASGICMAVSTNLPGIQLYTGNFLDGSVAMKGGRYANKHRAFCLETQYFPDAVNHADFETPVTAAGECKEYTTRFAFSVK